MTRRNFSTHQGLLILWSFEKLFFHEICWKKSQTFSWKNPTFLLQKWTFLFGKKVHFWSKKVVFFHENFWLFSKNFRGKIFFPKIIFAPKKKVIDKFSKSNFSMMKKYFSSNFFSNIKSLTRGIQRHQLELLGVSESEPAPKTIHRPPPRPEGQHRLHIFNPHPRRKDLSPKKC